jgi:hypothetical protein
LRRRLAVIIFYPPKKETARTSGPVFVGAVKINLLPRPTAIKQEAFGRGPESPPGKRHGDAAPEMPFAGHNEIGYRSCCEQLVADKRKRNPDDL